MDAQADVCLSVWIDGHAIVKSGPGGEKAERSRRDLNFRFSDKTDIRAWKKAAIWICPRLDSDLPHTSPRRYLRKPKQTQVNQGKGASTQDKQHISWAALQSYDATAATL